MDDKKFDEIERLENTLASLIEKIEKETDPGVLKTLTEAYSTLSKQHEALVKDEREFMHQSEDDADKEREYQMKKDQFDLQKKTAIAGIVVPLLTTGIMLCCKGRWFHNGLKFEVDNVPRSFFTREALNLNNLGKV